jgi:hypothetical protein
VSTAEPVVAIERAGFARNLTLRGERAFELSPGCDTCAFLFQRIKSERVSPEAVAGPLASDANLLEAGLLSTASKLIPSGDYAVSVLTVKPTLVSPCDAADYFSHESIDLFGIPTYTGVPDNPRIPYWRAGSLTLPPDSGAWPGIDGPRPRPTNPKRLFQFLVPFEPPQWLDNERIDHYRRLMEAGGRPAALGLAVLDVRATAVIPWDKKDNPDYVYAEHWCLATYLLDGHHKVQAAARSGRSLRVLTFVSREASIASDADVDAVLDVLSK